MIINDADATYRRRRDVEIWERGDGQDGRDVASCKLSAGLVPCHLVTFHLATNEHEFYQHIEKLVKFVQKSCNKVCFVLFCIIFDFVFIFIIFLGMEYSYKCATG